MKLGEILDGLPPDMVISVGADEAYFFIGEKRLLNTSVIDTVCKRRLATLIKRNKQSLKLLKANAPVREENEGKSEFKQRCEMFERSRTIRYFHF